LIKDSGSRRKFASGAVRDIQEGKGRCDLLPLEVVAMMYGKPVFTALYHFQRTGNHGYLLDAVREFCRERNWDVNTMLLEVSIHFEEGAKKYGENNWQKGIPVNCYLDSAIRHYLKWRRGDKDEPHDRAFIWNLMCCIYEVRRGKEIKK
jgi:hypothetical protein